MRTYSLTSLYLSMGTGNIERRSMETGNIKGRSPRMGHFVLILFCLTSAIGQPQDHDIQESELIQAQDSLLSLLSPSLNLAVCYSMVRQDLERQVGELTLHGAIVLGDSFFGKGNH